MRRTDFRTLRDSPIPNCALCGFRVLAHFGFCEGGLWFHPDCYIWAFGDDLGGISHDERLLSGKRLRHTCGEPSCVNPAHLELPDA